ncbi:MAG: ABC transporter permease [Spirochaetales bacterium]|uniref:ABC transporter permease n=1 Tax=Candidatus Thalassospirochaeta sargassi TaxID=3119039 RepID=A0AAJ1IE35_9SPIO|nr:ABC transporter permease [Spirochaetales bacterium]
MPALIVAGFFGIWQLAAVLIDSPVLPTFTAVALNLFTAEGLPQHLFSSMLRMIAGLSLAAATGLPLGIIAGMNLRGVNLINIPTYIFHPIPKTLFIPLIVLATGIGEFSKILLIFLSLVFQIILNVRDAVSNIPDQYYISLKTLGGRRLNILRYVTIPAALPGLFSTLRISMGIAAAVLFFAEYFGTEWGMGFYIMDAKTRINFTDLYSGILALSLMMLAFFRLLNWSEAQMCRWKHPSKVCFPACR